MYTQYMFKCFHFNLVCGFALYILPVKLTLCKLAICIMFV